MTAREKFIKRLKEEGLYKEWCMTGDFAGKVCKDGTVIVFLHYEWDNEDGYNEYHYPPFNELRDIEAFRKECEDRFYESDDDVFVASLARWLHYQESECPLYPVDLYWSELKLGEKVITFEDDADDDAKLVAEMVLYLGKKTGREFHGNINGISF